jgi:hypothetical protein
LLSSRACVLFWITTEYYELVIRISPTIFCTITVIDQLNDFNEQRDKAKTLFKTKSKPLFDKIKEKLTLLSNYTQRCVYCEDSFGDEVEHIYPKDLFPEKCFMWTNYIFACGTCNGTYKNNKFAVITTRGKFKDITPSRKATSIPKPPQGRSGFINPREENPLDYCVLDLNGTFKFIAIPGIPDIEKERVEFTYNQALGFDKREKIRIARKNAYGNYKARLYSYVIRKNEGASHDELTAMIDELKSENHPTVWQEMKRHYIHKWLNDPELQRIFDTEPDALTW